MAARAEGVRLRVELRRDKGAGPRARIFIGEVGPAQVEVTTPLTRAIAHALWQARGGDAAANWTHAEEAVDQLLAPLAGVTATEVKPIAARARTPKKKVSRR